MSGVRVDVLMRDVGARIAELRRLRGLTQSALGERVDASEKHLQRVEAGEENLTLRSLASYADALDVEVAALFRPPLFLERRRGRPRRALPAQSSASEERVPYGDPGIEDARTPGRAVVRLARVTPDSVSGPLVPLLTLLSVDGPAGAVVDAGVADFVELVGRRREPGLFVARLVGKPVAPELGPGALALFRTRLTSLPEGAVVLAATADDDRARRYRLRRLRVEGPPRSGLTLCRLEPLARGGKALTVELGPESPCRLVAALVEVVAPPRAASA